MSEAEQKRLALLAASQAAHAQYELLEVATGGPQGAHGVYDEEVVCLLADATKMAIEAEQLDGHRDEERDQLHAALCRFLDGWAG